MSSSNDPVVEHGWTAVPVEPEAIFKGKPYLNKPTPVLVKDIPFPSDDPIVAKVQNYAKEHLAWQAYNHSMRVLLFVKGDMDTNNPPATIILTQQLPTHHAPSPSTIALAALLHDIGTAPAFHTTTHMSFDFYGGILAHKLLSSPDYGPAPPPQAEAVAEAIIRHQDLGVKGTISLLGHVLQLATLYDNVGHKPYLLHPTARDDLNREFPRGDWGGCFAGIIREEVKAKPWAHSTHIGGVGGEEFWNALEGNLLMEGYE